MLEAPLHYMKRKNKNETENSSVFILMHGVGGNEKMLSFLAQQLPDDFIVFMLRAPYEMGTNSYSWFSVDFSTGDPVDNEDEAEKSRQIVIQFIEYIKEKYNYTTNKIFLGGFSQGGVLSFSVGLTRPELFHGIAVFSGKLLNDVRHLIVKNEALERLKIFIYHGTKDNILKVHYAHETIDYLEKTGLHPLYIETSDRHVINIKIFKQLNNWLKID